MELLEVLKVAAGFFEQGWDVDPDIFDSDQTEEYEDVIQQIREITGVFTRNTYIDEIKDSRNQLPHEKDWDFERDVKMDR